MPSDKFFRLLLVSQFILAQVILFAGTVSAQSHFAGLRVYHENDFIVPFATNTDDNYTGGLKVEVITNLINSKKSRILNPLRGDKNSLSLMFGVTAFTPQDLAATSIITTDRPYASYRYWGVGVSSINPKATWKLYYELELGAMGRPIAGEAQSYIHRHHWFGSQRADPKGWDYQIGFDGAMAINVSANLERQIWSSKLIGRKENFRWVQFTGRGYLNFGQYMINLAVEPRVSLFNWNHNFGEYEDEPGLPVKFTRPNGESIFRRKNKAGFYTFVGIRPRFVAHNATLTGKLISKSSVNTVDPSEVKKAIMECDMGMMFRWCFLRLGYNVFVRSKEFSYQNKNVHSWGGVYLGLMFRFK